MDPPLVLVISCASGGKIYSLRLSCVCTETTTTTTTTESMAEVEEYLSRLSTLLELMYAASELGDSDLDTTGRHRAQLLDRIRRSATPRRHRRSAIQRAKQVARKCCSGCSAADIQTLC